MLLILSENNESKNSLLRSFIYNHFSIEPTETLIQNARKSFYAIFLEAT